MNHTIYTSPNGYTGVLYGKSSMSIYDSNGKERLHTGRRNVETFEELVAIVDEFPTFLELFLGHKDELKGATKEGDAE